jgi:uncharacterized protein YodC (DUF2158 family)
MAGFQKGDVVVLKSGGPMMTVNGIGNYVENGGPENGVGCIWFDGNKQSGSVFDAATLEKYETAVPLRRR